VFLGFLNGEYLHLTEKSLELNPADRLILYSDGMIDTISPEGARFNRSGLHNLMKEVGHLPASELCDAVFDGLAEYQGTAEQFDDMTLLVVEVDALTPDPSPTGKGKDHSEKWMEVEK